MQLRVTKVSWFYAAIYLLLLIMLGIWFYQQNKPQQLPNPLSFKSDKLQCVSYAPYYGKDQAPYVKGMWISPEQIDSDLNRLSKISHCVRTYSVGQGMDYVPQAAAKIGLKVYLGAWIGWTDKDNIKEVNLAAAKANAYPDTVKALVIGNEVLLRREQGVYALQRYIALARAQTDTPITYADVWEFWIKYKSMEKYVDFVTVHILPYWENHPVAIEDAMTHAETVMAKLSAIFSKPILIGETGWPSVGRQRGESKPSLVNQARYMRAFIEQSTDKHWQYNLIEAIDQPWKRMLEGTVGGYWGMLDAGLNQKFSFFEPVAERQDRNNLLYLGIAGILVFLVITYLLKQKNIFIYIGLGSLGGLTSLIALLQYEYLFAAARDWVEWLILGGLALCGLALAVIQLWWLNRPSNQLETIIRVISQLFLYAAIVTSYLLATDGRYRDFPNILFALPVSILSFGMWFGLPIKNQADRLQWLACICAITIAAYSWMLEPDNVSAIVWVFLSLILVLANLPVKNLRLSDKSL